MDPLSDIVGLLRPHTIVAKHHTGSGDWGVRFVDYDAPIFSIMLSGKCWLSFENEPGKHLQLEAGDFLLVRSSQPMRMMSSLDAECCGGPFLENDLHYGTPDGDTNFEMLGGSFHIDLRNAHSLPELLPDSLHIRASESDTTELASLMKLITSEYFRDRPGRDAVLGRLLEVLLIESLRWHDLERDTVHGGLLAGMRDPKVARTLSAMHSNVTYDWTVAKLARSAGMSRSAYAKRFHDIVGYSPMEYLTRWRMSLARDALGQGSQTLETVALSIGYRSAAAFSNAFRRCTGCSPSSFGKQIKP